MTECLHSLNLSLCVFLYLNVKGIEKCCLNSPEVLKVFISNLCMFQIFYRRLCSNQKVWSLACNEFIPCRRVLMSAWLKLSP